MKPMRTILLGLLALPLAQGCGTARTSQVEEPPSSALLMGAAITPVDGSLWRGNQSLALFGDVKARQVGDTLTVQLAERTQASKSASTDLSRDSSVDTGSPILLGGPVTRNGKPILENEWQSSQSFTGKGSSTQGNRLDGNITVVVTEVFPNGNLLVQGEKWLTLNQGKELIKISGIVRPADISPDNAVPSFKIADARITYSGSGTLADANRPGLLSRIFLKVWPL